MNASVHILSAGLLRRASVGIAAILLAVLATGAADEGELPMLEAEPARIELGEITDVPVVRQDVLLHNHGTEPIRIVEIIHSCDTCLSTVLSDEVIEPGEIGFLSIQFDGLGYDGPVAKWVAVHLDRPEGAHLVIPVTATVEPLMRVLGGPLFFDGLAQQEERVLDVVLAPSPEMDLDGLRAESMLPGFEAHLGARDRRGTYLLSVRAIPPQPETGFLQSKVALYADGAADPVYAVPLLAQVIPPFHVAPQRLVLEAKDTEQFRIIFVRQRTDTPVRIVGVQVPEEHFSCRLFQDPSLLNSRISVYSWELSGQHGLIGHVVIETDRETERVVRIPLVIEDHTKGTEQRVELAPEQGSEAACGDEAEQNVPASVTGGYLERAKALFEP